MLHRKKDWATRTPLKKGGESERGLRYLMKVIVEIQNITQINTTNVK
jgi:hypothetical protein